VKIRHKLLIEDYFKEKIKSIQSLEGGCTASTDKITLENLCVLAKVDEPPRLKSEILGIKTIAESGSIKTPKILFHDNDLLVTEWIDSRPSLPSDYQNLATGLRKLHKDQSDFFGLKEDNFLGASFQINTPELSVSEGWEIFFWEYRLKPQLLNAAKHYAFLSNDIDRLKEATFERLQGVESSRLIHGDLWSGNILIDSQNSDLYLIDPAIYYGDADAEFGLIECFGGLPKLFYKSYYENSTGVIELENKIEVYKLYHLLNHLNIFGTGYLKQCQKVIEKLLKP